MGQILGYIAIFFIGCFIGSIILAVAASGGYYDKIQEVYNLGFEMGLKSRKD